MSPIYPLGKVSTASLKYLQVYEIKISDHIKISTWITSFDLTHCKIFHGKLLYHIGNLMTYLLTHQEDFRINKIHLMKMGVHGLFDLHINQIKIQNFH
jgi:hypothetical protein